MKKNSKGLYTTTITYNGKRYYIRAKTEKELWKKAAQKERDLEAGLITTNGNTTVSRWAREWLETYKKPSVRQGAYERYESIIRRRLEAHIGDVRMRDVRPVHLQQIVNTLAGRHTDTITKTIATLRAVFDRARKNGIIPTNPAADLDKPQAVPNGSRRALTDEERKAILAVAETHRAGLWVKMILYCGLRPAETVALQWCDLSLDADRPRVRVEKALEARTSEIKTPKTQSGARSVPIPRHYADELRAVRPADNPFGYVFERPNGKRHTATTLRTLWRDFKTAVDIEMGAQTAVVEQTNKHAPKKHRQKTVIVKSVVADDLVPYCLRHTYCTDLQAAGVTLNVAKEFMGHSDIAMTSRIYTHSSEAATNAADDAINAHFGATSGATANAPNRPKNADSGDDRESLARAE